MKYVTKIALLFTKKHLLTKKQPFLTEPDPVHFFNSSGLCSNLWNYCLNFMVFYSVK